MLLLWPSSILTHNNKHTLKSKWRLYGTRQVNCLSVGGQTVNSWLSHKAEWWPFYVMLGLLIIQGMGSWKSGISLSMWLWQSKYSTYSTAARVKACHGRGWQTHLARNPILRQRAAAYLHLCFQQATKLTYTACQKSH